MDLDLLYQFIKELRARRAALDHTIAMLERWTDGDPPPRTKRRRL